MNTISVLMFIFNHLDSIECKIYISSYILNYMNMEILNHQNMSSNMVDVEYLYETSTKLDRLLYTLEDLKWQFLNVKNLH